MLEITIFNDEKVPITINPTDDAGIPATEPAFLDVPTWTVIAGNGGLEVEFDGRSAFCVSTNTEGDTTYLVNAINRLGVTITDNVLVHTILRPIVVRSEE